MIPESPQPSYQLARALQQLQNCDIERRMFLILCNYNGGFIKAIENVFRVCIAWYKQESGWENSRQLREKATRTREF